MFLYTQFPQFCEISSIPRKVCVSIPQAGHKSATLAFDNSDIGVLLKAFFVWDMADCGVSFTWSEPERGSDQLSHGLQLVQLAADIPSINTSPLYGSLPVESKILTSVIKIFESGLVPAISYFFGVKLLSNCIASMAWMFRGGPEYGSTSAAVLLHEAAAAIVFAFWRNNPCRRFKM